MEHMANSVGQHETGAASAGLLIEGQDLEQAGSAGMGQLDADGQTGLFEEIDNPRAFVPAQAGEGMGQPAGGDHADSDRFPMKIAPVAGERFDAMADGVTEIQDGPKAAFLFILGDDLGFDVTAAGDDSCQNGSVARQDFSHAPFQESEKGGIPNHAVFDDLGQAGTELARGKCVQDTQVGQNKFRLVKGADEIFCGSKVDTDFAADGAVDLGQQGGGDLNKTDASEIGGGDEAGQVAHDSAPKGDDEGLAIQPVVRQFLVTAINNREAFRGFSRRDDDEARMEILCAEGAKDAVGVVRGDTGIRNDGASFSQIKPGTFAAQDIEQVIADSNAIAP